MSKRTIVLTSLLGITVGCGIAVGYILHKKQRRSKTNEVISIVKDVTPLSEPPSMRSGPFDILITDRDKVIWGNPNFNPIEHVPVQDGIIVDEDVIYVGCKISDDDTRFVVTTYVSGVIITVQGSTEGYIKHIIKAIVDQTIEAAVMYADIEDAQKQLVEHYIVSMFNI